VRLVVYYGATIFAFFCLWYGVTRLDKPNFDTPPRPACSQCISTAPDSGSEKPFSNYARWRIGFLFFWIALPPAWFWLDYFGLYRYDPVAGKVDRESFIYGQDVASRIWLALVTALTILDFGKDLCG
jgi:hypothetical protein